jgi:hypothetical protein
MERGASQYMYGIMDMDRKTKLSFFFFPWLIVWVVLVIEIIGESLRALEKRCEKNALLLLIVLLLELCFFIAP